MAQPFFLSNTHRWVAAEPYRFWPKPTQNPFKPVSAYQMAKYPRIAAQAIIGQLSDHEEKSFAPMYVQMNNPAACTQLTLYYTPYGVLVLPLMSLNLEDPLNNNFFQNSALLLNKDLSAHDQISAVAQAETLISTIYGYAVHGHLDTPVPSFTFTPTSL